MRQLLVTILCAAALYSQPAGNRAVRWADGGRIQPASRWASCKELRSLTSLDLSVIGATVIPASAGAAASTAVSA